MKEILIYGDSYVYGKIPGGDRYSISQRFSGLVQEMLGSDYMIVEEGLRGRMLFGENKYFPERDGFQQFGPIVGSHLPLDLIVFVLGANDCNSGNELEPHEIANKYALYLDKIKFWCEFHKCLLPQILIVTPPILDEISAQKAFGNIFAGSAKKSKLLQDTVYDVSKDFGWEVLKASEHVSVSSIDGIHLDLENNRKLATQITTIIQSILK